MCEYQKHLAHTKGHEITDISSIENYRVVDSLEFLVVWKTPELRPTWEKHIFFHQCQNIVVDFLHREEKKSAVRAACIRQALINNEFPLNSNEKHQENKIEKILGVFKQNRQDIYFSVLMKGQHQPISISNTAMKKNYPKELIHFYESIISFTEPIHAP